jgi:uncharacterized protein
MAHLHSGPLSSNAARSNVTRVIAPSPEEKPGFLAGLRAAASALVSRSKFTRGGGKTYDGKRDVDEALGYQETLEPVDYRLRYERNEMAGCIVDAFPVASWRGGGELVEDDDPETVTTFEEQFFELADRLEIWPRLMRADILAGLGRYAIVVIGDGHALDAELRKMRAPDDVLFLSVYAEEHAEITDIVTDFTDPRYGRPQFYACSNVVPELSSGARLVGSKVKVHFSRVVHIADGLLDDDVYGQPRLRRVWNRLDDLVKVVGGGSEAFWQRSQQGLQLDLDKDIELDKDGKKELQDEVDEYLHGFRRVMRTQGVTVNPLGSDVANFGPQVDAILTLVAGGSRIPKRILTGSEQGELASSQDKTNWDERVQDRRENFCGPAVVRQLVDRLIEHGALVEPKDGYVVRWPEIENMDELARANIALRYAQANKSCADAGLDPVITSNEIRDSVLDLGPIDQAELAGQPGRAEPPPADPTVVDPATDPAAVDPAAVPAAARAARRRNPRRSVSLERLRMAKLSLRTARLKAAGVPNARFVAAKKKTPATLYAMPQTGTCRARGAS